MNPKPHNSSAVNPDLELVDAAIAFMRAAQKHSDASKPIAGARIHPDGSLMDYAVGLAHAAMGWIGGNGPVRDIDAATGNPEGANLQSSLQELIARRDAYVRKT